MSCPICDGGGDAYLCENEECGFVGFCEHCVLPECPDCGGTLVAETDIVLERMMEAQKAAASDKPQ